MSTTNPGLIPEPSDPSDQQIRNSGEQQKRTSVYNKAMDVQEGAMVSPADVLDVNPINPKTWGTLIVEPEDAFTAAAEGGEEIVAPPDATRNPDGNNKSIAFTLSKTGRSPALCEMRRVLRYYHKKVAGEEPDEDESKEVRVRLTDTNRVIKKKLSTFSMEELEGLNADYMENLETIEECYLMPYHEIDPNSGDSVRMFQMRPWGTMKWMNNHLTNFGFVAIGFCNMFIYNFLFVSQVEWAKEGLASDLLPAMFIALGMGQLIAGVLHSLYSKGGIYANGRYYLPCVFLQFLGIIMLILVCRAFTVMIDGRLVLHPNGVYFLLFCTVICSCAASLCELGMYGLMEYHHERCYILFHIGSGLSMLLSCIMTIGVKERRQELLEDGRIGLTTDFTRSDSRYQGDVDFSSTLWLIWVFSVLGNGVCFIFVYHATLVNYKRQWEAGLDLNYDYEYDVNSKMYAEEKLGLPPVGGSNPIESPAVRLTAPAGRVTIFRLKPLEHYQPVENEVEAERKSARASAAMVDPEDEDIENQNASQRARNASHRSNASGGSQRSGGNGTQSGNGGTQPGNAAATNEESILDPPVATAYVYDGNASRTGEDATVPEDKEYLETAVADQQKFYDAMERDESGEALIQETAAIQDIVKPSPAKTTLSSRAKWEKQKKKLVNMAKQETGVHRLYYRRWRFTAKNMKNVFFTGGSNGFHGAIGMFLVSLVPILIDRLLTSWDPFLVVWQVAIERSMKLDSSIPQNSLELPSDHEVDLELGTLTRFLSRNGFAVIMLFFSIAYILGALIPCCKCQAMWIWEVLAFLLSAWLATEVEVMCITKYVILRHQVCVAYGFAAITAFMAGLCYVNTKMLSVLRITTDKTIPNRFRDPALSFLYMKTGAFIVFGMFTVIILTATVLSQKFLARFSDGAFSTLLGKRVVPNSIRQSVDRMGNVPHFT